MTSTTSKTPCITCGKGTGLFKCEGCTQTFCTKHVVEHRQKLHHQLDEIIVEHDTLHQTIIENKDQKHPLINFIDEWEQKSIKTIQQIAQETRQKVEELANIHTKTIAEELMFLTERIKKSREEDDFSETDLKNWISTLDRLKKELTNAPSSHNMKEDQSAPLIYHLTLGKTSSDFNDKCMSIHHQTDSKLINYADIFERCLDGAKIEDNGRVVIHGKGNFAVEVRGKAGYSSGTHRFRLQIEKSSLGTWIFFGIISKSTLMTKNSYQSSSAYGWADYNDFVLAGIRQNNETGGQFSHTQQNDIISLVLDCTTRTISYTNERNQKNQEIKIDINKCPFPWQLHLNVFGENDQVRLLSVMSAL